ncbi:MAG: PIG-L deacetylase family protein, partial [Actinomycetota bacterium]
MSANDPGQPPLEFPRARYDEWTRNISIPHIALAIGAHPDDVEFGCGGTLAKWAAAGATIHHLVLTDGSKGTWDVSADTALLVQRRQAEQREAATRLGAAGEVRFISAVDGELAHNPKMVDAVALTIR